MISEDNLAARRICECVREAASPAQFEVFYAVAGADMGKYITVCE